MIDFVCNDEYLATVAITPEPVIFDFTRRVPKSSDDAKNKKDKNKNKNKKH